MKHWLWYTIFCGGGVVMLAWAAYLTRSGHDYHETLRTRLHRAWRRLVFFAGDIRIIHNVLEKVPLIGRIPLLNRLPGFTWDIHQHRVEYGEALASLPVIRKGDVGLHRDSGYLSNLAIPGFMKHAWIHVDGPVSCTGPDGEPRADVTGMSIVEAVSEGVLKRSALFPVRSDYTIILRPRNASAADVDFAVEKAEKIIGYRYDADFKFDIEEELRHTGMDRGPGGESESEEAAREREAASGSLKAKWDGGFSCTETVSFAWWHRRRELRLFRKPARGKQVILADQMINNGFEIVWMSESVTPEIASELGLGEEGVEMIRAHRLEEAERRLAEGRAASAAEGQPPAAHHRPPTNRISNYQRH